MGLAEPEVGQLPEVGEDAGGEDAPAPPVRPPEARAEPVARIIAPVPIGSGSYRTVARYRGLIPRFLAIHRHLVGLGLGALADRGRRLRLEHRRGLRVRAVRLLAAIARPCLARDLRDLPFASQLRRRLELLGPTYVKFGQILAIREDLLPAEICRELQALFDHVPAVPFPTVRGQVERS